jgi:8-oxo-dGTP diphosphatase
MFPLSQTGLFLSMIGDCMEKLLRCLIVALTNYLPVKVIRDDKGVPFLYRYHLFMLGPDGPGMCIHRFVKSDPERGYHDHPWSFSMSFILCGGYHERILSTETKEGYVEKWRNRFTFNHLDGHKTFHRVMIEEGKDAWTLFYFQKRSKTWGMIGLDRVYRSMSSMISDNDGGWWNTVKRGLGLHSRLPLSGNVVATVDIIVLHEMKVPKDTLTRNEWVPKDTLTRNEWVLLIKRGKDPYKDCWALPGGRVEPEDKDLLSAAKRELKEETSLTDVDLQYVTTIGNNTRDPRGFCITSVFQARLQCLPIATIRAGDDAVDYEWFSLDNLPDMAFDHKDIITSVLKV